MSAELLKFLGGRGEWSREGIFTLFLCTESFVREGFCYFTVYGEANGEHFVIIFFCDGRVVVYYYCFPKKECSAMFRAFFTSFE